VCVWWWGGVLFRAGRPRPQAAGFVAVITSNLIRSLVEGMQNPQVIERGGSYSADAACLPRRGFEYRSRRGAAAPPLCATSRVPWGTHSPGAGGLPICRVCDRRGPGYTLLVGYSNWWSCARADAWRQKSMATSGQISRVICQKRNIPTLFRGTSKISSPSLWLLRYIQPIFDWFTSGSVFAPQVPLIGRTLAPGAPGVLWSILCQVHLGGA
jgi:hypothetical protein